MKRIITALLAGSLLAAAVCPVYGTSFSEKEKRLPEEIEDKYFIHYSEQLQEEDRSIHTFEDTILLTGEAFPGGRILRWVYTLSPEGNTVIWLEEEEVLGGSGLYQMRIPLKRIGEQKAVILFFNDNKPGSACERIIRISCCRHEQKIKEQLKEYRFNIYEIIGEPS